MSSIRLSETARAAFVPSGEYQQFIGGDWVSGRSTFDAIDPSVGSAWAVLPQGTAADAQSAVSAAVRAFGQWRRTTQDQRQAILLSIADRFESDGERFGALLATENGRPVREAGIADIPTVAAIFRFYAGVIRAFNGEQIPLANADTLLYTKREPLGVVAAIISWNSPLITFANKVAPALAAGNTVVVKPSEYASASILAVHPVDRGPTAGGCVEHRDRSRPRDRSGVGLAPRCSQDHVHRRTGNRASNSRICGPHIAAEFDGARR
ncbi:aldehyde dehydrogenase family protein [Rhodococcus sp. P1Y]|uniref:aldehyde dehydrogenase family protein n=1 Tax=Rhodococcus sp. P1Y TaxID=1302308 RepID=UPI0026A5065B